MTPVIFAIDPARCRHPKWRRLSTRDLSILAGYPVEKGITGCSCGTIFDAREVKP